MCLKFLPIVTLSLWSAGTLLLSGIASAEVKLTNATIQKMQNQVEFLPSGQRWRGAAKGMTMQPLDALKTSVKSWAELRFNDRSLARVGERALFQFLPNTRTFNLQNGTVLLLIPPGQGRTQLQTPNAITGIRGSALFVRYNPNTQTTLVGALTNSEIEVGLNIEGTQPVTLKAGQMAVLVQNQGPQIFNFDLKSFYETSEIVKDLDLSRQNQEPSSDEAIAAVQAETAEALQAQTPIAANSNVSVNPAWISLGTPPAENNPSPTTAGISVNQVEGITNVLNNIAIDLGRNPPPAPTTDTLAPVTPVPPVTTTPAPSAAPPPPDPPRPVPTPGSNVTPQRPIPTPDPIAPAPAPVATPQAPALPPPIVTQPAPQTPVAPAPPITQQPPVTPQPTTPDPVRPQPLPFNPTPVVTPPPAPAPVVQPAPVAAPSPPPVQVIRPVPTPAPVTPAPVVNPPTTAPPVVTTPPTVIPTPIGAATPPAIAPTAPPAVTPVPPTVELVPQATSLTAPNLTPTNVTPPTNVVSPSPSPAPAATPVPTPSVEPETPTAVSQPPIATP